MRVDLTATITVMETRALKVRQGAGSVDMETIGKLLEDMTDDDRPVVLEIFGTRADKQPGDFYLRECRGIFVYQSAVYKRLEEKRQREEKRDEKERLRDVELNRIKTRLRAERKADDESFDKKYDEQTKERVEITEREIEREAVAILAKEEGTDKC